LADHHPGERETSGSRNTTKFGFWVSGIYVAGLVAFLVVGTLWGWVGWPESLRINEIGDFLAGAFSPLAFLWLVLGFIQQGRELRLQVAELAQSVHQQKELVGVTRETLDHERTALLTQTEADRLRNKPQLRLKLTDRRPAHIVKADGSLIKSLAKCRFLITNTGNRLSDLTFHQLPSEKAGKPVAIVLLEGGAHDAVWLQIVNDTDPPDQLVVACTSADGRRYELTFAIQDDGKEIELLEEAILTHSTT